MKKGFNIRNSIFMVVVLLIFITFSSNVYANQYREQTDLNSFDSNRYPGYKERLQALKAQHPNWNFTILYTGLDWNTVVYNETTGYHGRSLVQNKTGGWLCSSCGNKVYDGSNWYCASVEAVSYYLDARNFLSTEQMFQFETLSYVDGIYTELGVETILQGTFMYNKSIREYYNNSNYTESKFSTVIMEAAREARISPYHIASRIKQEIIVSGGGPSRSVTGTVEGYEGYYNFFNIGATAGDGAVERGLKYAQAKGWNAPEKSLKDGAKTLATNYISRGQNTLYLEKFDIDSSDNTIYSHQYQQNIKAPANEGKKVFNTYYRLGMIDTGYNFVIPVFENMPQDNATMPNEDFMIVTQNVEINTDGVTVKASANASSESITTYNRGVQLLRIEKTNTWDKVVLSDGRKGYVETKFLNKINDIVTTNELVYVQENVNVRNGPGLNGTSIITKLYSGTQLTRIDAGKYNLDGYIWDRVILPDGTQGYLANKFIAVNSTELSGETVKVIANGSLKLRERPTTDSSTITSLVTGTLLTRLEKNVANANGLEWDKVKTMNGTIGYVASKYVEAVAPAVTTPVAPEPDVPVQTVPTNTNNFKKDDNNKIVNCTPLAKLNDIKSTYQNSIVKDKNGNEISDVNISLATGMHVTIENEVYQIIKNGDVSGDGIVDARDSLRILKYVVGEYNLDEKIYWLAGDVSGDKTVDARDSLRILKYTVGDFKINV